MSDFDFEQTRRRNKENKEREEKDRKKNNAGVFRSHKISTPTNPVAPPPPAKQTYAHASQPLPKVASGAAEPAKVLAFVPKKTTSTPGQLTAPDQTQSPPQAQSQAHSHSSAGHPQATPLDKPRVQGPGPSHIGQGYSGHQGQGHQGQGHHGHGGQARGDALHSLPTNSINFVALDKAGRIYTVFLDETSRGSLAISSDNGNTWLAPEKKQWRHIVSASIESNAGLYIKTVERGDNASFSILHSSADGGRSWESIRLLSCSRGLNEVYAVSTKGEVYLGTGDGLFRRRAADKPWERLLPENSSIKDAWTYDIKLGKLDVATGVQKIYAMSKGGLLTSSDWGKSWQLFATHFAQSTTMVAVDDLGGVYLGSMGHGLRVSKDHGRTWVTRPLPDYVADNHIVNIQVKSGVIYATLWGMQEGGGGLAVSRDDGCSWRLYSKENSDLSDNDITSLWVDDSGRVYAGTLNQGLCVSSADLSRWEVLTKETTGSHKVSP